jgi:hypothetical protein
MNNRKTSTESIAELAVAALDGNPNPLDMDLSGIGESPSDLDLEGSQEAMRSDPRRSECIICGQPPCDD